MKYLAQLDETATGNWTPIECGSPEDAALLLLRRRRILVTPRLRNGESVVVWVAEATPSNLHPNGTPFCVTKMVAAPAQSRALPRTPERTDNAHPPHLH